MLQFPLRSGRSTMAIQFPRHKNLFFPGTINSLRWGNDIARRVVDLEATENKGRNG